MRQLPLFDDQASSDVVRAAEGALDPSSERLLDLFRSLRLANHAHPRSVAREVSQLRSIARESGRPGAPIPLSALLADLSLVARALCEPRTPIARSTGRARLLGVQRFVRVLGPRFGRDVTDDLAVLDALLPGRRSTDWHRAGTSVAGTSSRRRRLGPTLDVADLQRIVDAAGRDANARFDRDRALVALHCFSGLRAEEIPRLRWTDLTTELTVGGSYRVTVEVHRNGKRLRLPLPAPAAEMVEALARGCGGSIESLSGPLFLVRMMRPQALSYRAARDILRAACQRAGISPVGSVELRSACAHWLRTQGLSSHEVAAVLGLARVRSVDELLRRHEALVAQRRVREVLAR